MREKIDYTKSYSAHYIQLGNFYVRNAMLSFDEKHCIRLSAFDREYPRTIFLSGTIFVYNSAEGFSAPLDKIKEISLAEMQELLDQESFAWSILLP